MNSSLGIIEIKGYCAVISALDNLLKNSTTAFHIEELQNGNFIMYIKGGLAEVKHAIGLTIEHVNKISTIHSYSIIDKLNSQIEALFWNNREKKSVWIQKAESGKTSGQKKEVIGQKLYRKKTRLNSKSDSEMKLTTDSRKSVSEERQREINTIERLRLEALGKTGESKPLKKKIPEKIFSFKVESLSDLEGLNVHKLRRAARDFENFPIKGRQISKANRDELVEYFKRILPS